MEKLKEKGKQNCYYCGSLCCSTTISFGDKYFCSNGCRENFETLYGSDSCSDYSINEVATDLNISIDENNFSKVSSKIESIGEKVYAVFDKSKLFLKNASKFLTSIGEESLITITGVDRTSKRNQLLRIGFTILFIRSLYEIIFFGNVGFIVSLAVFVIFLSLVKSFRNNIYDPFFFARDYKSYFPISVTLKKEKCEQSIPVSKLQTGDRIIIRNNEIVPVDSILFRGTSTIDYSFVTGESMPEQKVLGEIIYGGGRHSGSVIELEVIRTASQRYLTQLWNSKAAKRKIKSNLFDFTNLINEYFSIAILTAAFMSVMFRIPGDIILVLIAYSTVLIVICSLSIVLTTSFVLDNILSIFRKNKFYLKNAFVVDGLSKIDSIVFDKTGTITNSKETEISFVGNELSMDELAFVKTLVRNSSHPLSKKIYDSIDADEYLEVDDFSESFSEGISCKINGNEIKMGTMRFILKDLDCSFYDMKHEIKKSIFSTNVFLSINHFIKGYYSFNNKYRNGLSKLIEDLSDNYSLSVSSGDNCFEKNNLEKYFKGNSNLLFNQSAAEKFNYIKALQRKGKTTLMVGDGLNDIGALYQSDVGILVSEDNKNFFPSCDAMIEASEFSKIGKFMKFSKLVMNVIKSNFSTSLVYHVVVLFFAVQGMLSPLIAVLLILFGSILSIFIVIGLTNLIGRRRGLL